MADTSTGPAMALSDKRSAQQWNCVAAPGWGDYLVLVLPFVPPNGGRDNYFLAWAPVDTLSKMKLIMSCISRGRQPCPSGFKQFSVEVQLAARLHKNPLIVGPLPPAFVEYDGNAG